MVKLQNTNFTTYQAPATFKGKKEVKDTIPSSNELKLEAKTDSIAFSGPLREPPR